MKLPRKRLVAGMAAVALLCVVASGWYLFSPDSPLNKKSAVECALLWGRLAPFPASVRDFAITAEGGMFSRAFRAKFTAPQTDIEQWLKNSPGTSGASPSVPRPGIRQFDIAPGGGAQHAEVTVNDASHQVLIYVYWS